MFRFLWLFLVSSFLFSCAQPDVYREASPEETQEALEEINKELDEKGEVYLFVVPADEESVEILEEASE